MLKVVRNKQRSWQPFG